MDQLLAFADGDILSATSGGNGTISSGGIGAAGQDFVFSITTANGVYSTYFQSALTTLLDRTYRFDVSDSSMAGRDFKFSQTANGEYGPDGDFSTTGDNGVELQQVKPLVAPLVSLVHMCKLIFLKQDYLQEVYFIMMVALALHLIVLTVALIDSLPCPVVLHIY